MFYGTTCTFWVANALPKVGQPVPLTLNHDYDASSAGSRSAGELKCKTRIVTRVTQLNLDRNNCFNVYVHDCETLATDDAGYIIEDERVITRHPYNPDKFEDLFNWGGDTIEMIDVDTLYVRYQENTYG